MVVAVDWDGQQGAAGHVQGVQSVEASPRLRSDGPPRDESTHLFGFAYWVPRCSSSEQPFCQFEERTRRLAESSEAHLPSRWESNSLWLLGCEGRPGHLQPTQQRQEMFLALMLQTISYFLCMFCLSQDDVSILQLLSANTLWLV